MPKRPGTFDFSAVQGLEGVTVVHSCGAGHVSKRHSHQSLTLGAVLSGRREVVVRGEAYCVDAGSVLRIAPCVAHACRDVGACECVVLSIAPRRLAALGCDAALLNAAHPVSASPHAFDGLVRFHQALAVQAPVRQCAKLLAQAVRAALCGDDVTGASSAPMRQAVAEHIARAAQYLEANPQAVVRLEDLAAMACLSPCRLNRTFSRVYGMPPHEFHSLMRTREARRLIADGAPLAHVAAQCGFADQSHMNRVFKNVVGMTPGQYARAFQPAPAAQDKAGARLTTQAAPVEQTP